MEDGSKMIRQADFALWLRKGGGPESEPVGDGASLLWSGRNGCSNAGGAELMAAWGSMAAVKGAPVGEVSSCAISDDESESAVPLPRKEITSTEEALRAVRIDGRQLRECAAALRQERELVLAAVAGCGMALKFASHGLRDDAQVVEAAVRQEGCALRYASEALRQHKHLVAAAVAQNWRALRFASPALREEAEIVVPAARENIWALALAGETLRANPEVMTQVGSR